MHFPDEVFMSTSMRQSYDEALSRNLIGDIRLGVDFQYSPWDTNCFMAVFYLEFADQSGRTGERDWLYFAAFVAHPAHSAVYNRSVEHGRKNAGAFSEQNLVAALHFITSPEVNCVYADPGLFPAAVDLHPEIKNLIEASPEARERSLLPKGVIQLRDMIMQEITEGHDYWRTIWRPRIADAVVCGPAWFF